MDNRRVYITDLGHKHIFIEANVPSKVFTEILEEFKQKGFFAFGVATGN
jgi:predicted transcriptional regulator